MKNLDLTDAEADALIQELSGTINYALSFFPSHPDAAGDPQQAGSTASTTSSFAGAEGLCAAE